jgi:hypothetical protein
VVNVLIQINLIEGVEQSYADDTGTLLRLNLRPGADPQKVADRARRVLEQRVEDRTVVRLRGESAAVALRQEWHDRGRVALRAEAEEQAQSEAEQPAEGNWLLWLVWLLVLLALGLLLLVWWRRRARAEAEKAGGSDPPRQPGKVSIGRDRAR